MAAKVIRICEIETDLDRNEVSRCMSDGHYGPDEQLAARAFLRDRTIV